MLKNLKNLTADVSTSPKHHGVMDKSSDEFVYILLRDPGSNPASDRDLI